jgi:nicotinamidase-related amidase
VTPPSAFDGPLLVVIDMQRVFAQPDSPWHSPDFQRIVPSIQRLAAAFGDRTVFTRFVVPAEPRGSWREYYREWHFIREPAAAPLLDLVPPWTGRPTIDKPTFSAFGPELCERAGSSSTLVICGVSTECCVLATAIAAADAGMAVRIVADACASVDAITHESALRVARVGFSPLIAMTTVEEELAQL